MEDAAFGVVLNLKNHKFQFTGVSKDNPDRPVEFDYLPPIGDGQGFRGLELLLLSFSGCVSTAMVHFLRQTGKDFRSYQMDAQGYKNDKPLSLRKISAEIIVGSDDITDEEVQDAIKKAALISPVWLALNSNIEVDMSFVIQRN